MNHEKLTSVALLHLQGLKVTQPSLELAGQKVPELGSGVWGDGDCCAFPSQHRSFNWIHERPSLSPGKTVVMKPPFQDKRCNLRCSPHQSLHCIPFPTRHWVLGRSCDQWQAESACWEELPQVLLKWSEATTTKWKGDCRGVACSPGYM